MDSLQIVYLLMTFLIILNFWLISAEERIEKYRRIHVLNENVCPQVDVITVDQPLGRIKCLTICTENPVCKGVFHHPLNQNCILCSAKYLTHENVSQSGSYMFYDVNSTVTVYWLVKELMSKDEAQEVCESLGGTLASIKTSEENDYIRESVLNDCVEHVWVGATGIGGNGSTFIWQDGSFIRDEFINWMGGQPFYPQSNAPACLRLQYDANFRWNDFDCTTQSYGLCSLN